MPKPIMLLDIDGVVNAVGSSIPAQAWPRHDWGFGDLLGFPLKWAKPVVAWLTKLHTDDKVEIRWHTTWQEGAWAFGDLVGLPKFEVQDCPEWDRFNLDGAALAADLVRACQPPWWKYPAAERLYAAGAQPLIWVDDDITYEIPRRVRAELSGLGRLCLISPSQSTGLCPKHMRQVDTFLERLEDPRGAVSGS